MIPLKDMITPVQDSTTIHTSLKEALEIMKQNGWNLLPVTDEGDKLVGVFTRSSLYRMIMDKRDLETSIEEYIKKKVSTLPITATYEEVEGIVRTSRVGTGVVVDHGERVMGLFTKTDMVLSLLKATNTLKEQLETVLTHSTIGVMMTDEFERVIYSNERVCKMLGISTSELHSAELLTVLPEIGQAIKHTDTIQPIKLDRLKAVLTMISYQNERNRVGHIFLFQDLSEVESIAQELESVKSLKLSLQTAIDHAYDGIMMTDEKQCIQMVSPSLLELFQMEQKNILFKKADNVFPQFQLSKVYESETAEVSDFKEINGIKYIVHRIPILQDGKVVGAIGKIMYRQLNEVSELFKKLQKAENKANYYHSQYQKAESAKFTWDHIISKDPYMEKLKKSAVKAAKGRSTILIRGESGTGKELFAHAVHNSSARKEGKFVVVNCAAIPEDLLESEFFGYEDGAFTGARNKGKVGKFDLANGGTLFLDEIGDMSLNLQAKLLRVLQEREFYRVGGTKRIQVDVRIIAATNRNLEEMVKEGTFREDLYYRLNVISFHIPPLRDRVGDIHLLIGKMLTELNAALNTSITGMEPQASAILETYQWPGNVRELRNVLERAMTFAEHGRVQLEDLPEYMVGVRREKYIPTYLPEEKMAESAERNAIENALEKTKGNKAKAARILGISRSGLYEKIKKYQLI
ncbi:transcriptional regulator with PAS, ATPase and Fis domain [Bacillus tianshenii]|uniref:Transcriptional regulator with PAS, ATPase and Fis domain n=1 Tax=Sutcliffiella tianshenii TaxID=1463404 RepID=A0ABS2P3N5_9BACI|nr:sigma-54-dependent Fis family transcriptional regulator [Bacillus tianshenii]MBM7621577.1 transcriptional regulator with PAS, ATPase and Fis domain [Bacillus tianshenii]